MNTIPGNNGVAGSAVDTQSPTRPITLAEQMAIDNDAFYDTSGGGFATEASYQTRGTPAVMIRGMFERKPVISDVGPQFESYVPTFRAPNMEVNGAGHGAILVIDRKSWFVIHVERDSNGDTVMTLSQNDYGNALTPTNR